MPYQNLNIMYDFGPINIKVIESFEQDNKINFPLFKLMFSRFTVSQCDPYLKKVSELTYQGMKVGTELLLKDMNTSDILLVTTKVWSVIHGLSYLIIDGHLDLATQNIDELLLSFFKESM